MNRLITITLSVVTTVMICCLNPIQAQNQFAAETYVGVNGGYALSMVNFLPSVRQTFQPGYQGGVVFRHNSQNHMGVQAELNYMQRGWNEESGYVRQLNYIELPFMSHFYFGNKIQFFINIGPKLSYLLNDKGLSPPSTPSQAVQYGELTRPLDYGFCGGFGLQVRFGRQIVLLDSRVNYSISTLFPDRLTDHFRNSNHMNASLSAAWLIRTN
ncbi:MAG: PorT family protein [Bacteroidales bacterium]|nr:PorT family protein [Bacteroidales bacterium]